ncbi:MAG: FliA/WhiG family RNA polymerase sigma factor [Deltaproteobacteria bacterium]|nr:FliA/WhiG family RNA polymerase sigma factor [Deltaproteobacteria bacterium]
MNNPYARQAFLGKTREDVVLEYAPLVRQIANRLAARLPDNLDREDLVQAGMIGLLDAMEKYDPGREAQFRTYAEFRIKGAMLDDLRSVDWVPRSVRENAYRIGHAHQELSATLGRAPDEEELARKLGLSLAEYQELLIKSRAVNMLSIQDLGHADADGDHGDIHDVLADPFAGDPLEILSLRDLRSRMAKAIQALPEREQVLLSLYYDEGLNLKEIGLVMGITESRVSQIRTQAIIRLRGAVGGQFEEGELNVLLSKRDM